MSPMEVHATVSTTDNTVKVLLLAKDLEETSSANVELCIRGASLSSPALAKSLISTTDGASAKTGIRYGGQTWDGSVQGELLGDSTVVQLVGVDGGASGVCYSVTVPPLSAMVIQAPRATVTVITEPAVTISSYDRMLPVSASTVSVTIDYTATGITAGLTATVSFKQEVTGGSAVWIAGQTVSLSNLEGSREISIDIPSR